MMLGVGFIKNAESTRKTNRDNLKNKSNFKSNYKIKVGGKSLIFKEPTKEELEEYRIKLSKEKKSNQYKSFALLTFIASVIGILFWWFLFF